MRLTEGAYRHPYCPQCHSPRGTKTYPAPHIRVVLRRRWCEQLLVDWSIVLQTNYLGRWVDVHRFSIAHANFHAIQSFRLRRRPEIDSISPVNSQNGVSESYALASMATYRGARQYLLRWEEGP